MVMEEEEWRERAGEEMERTYLKRLAVVDVTMEENDAAAWGTSQRWALPQRIGRWYCCNDGTIPPRTTSECQRRTYRRRWGTEEHLMEVQRVGDGGGLCRHGVVSAVLCFF